MLAMDVNPTTSFCMMYFHGNPVATRTAQLSMGPIQPADWFYVFDIWYYIKLPTFFHSSKIEFQIKKGTADLFMFIIPINHPLIHFGEGGGQQFWAICSMNICRFSVFFLPSPVTQEKQSQFQLLGALGFAAMITWCFLSD